MNRRQFMKTTVLSAAAASLAPEAFSKQAAEARVRVAVLGSGARAQGLMKEVLELPGVEFVAVCDAYRGRAERARAMTEESARIETTTAGFSMRTTSTRSSSARPTTGIARCPSTLSPPGRTCTSRNP
jgi:hypothetical protein